MTATQPPPADITAEAKLLGALLYDQRHVSAMPPKLIPESFYSEAHRQIFTAIRALRDDRVDVNLTTVETRLRQTGQLPKLADGGAYLETLVDSVPVISQVTFEELAKVVMNRATQRATQLLLQRAVSRMGDPTLVDVHGELAELERQLLGLSLQAHDSGGLQPVKAALRAEVTEWGERVMGRGTPGTSTGFDAYDRMTGGLHRGDFVVVAARPGMGKTSWVTSACVNVTKRGDAAAIFSLEMPARQLAGRMLCTEAGISIARTRAGKLAPNELTTVQMALRDLAGLGIYIDDAARGRPYVADIVARTRRLAAELAREGKRIGVVVVDYLQIVKLRDVLVRQRHELAVGEVSTELKSLAKELDTTVIGVAQLNRSVESRTDKRPGMADLRDSGQIEQDADLVLMLYRDEYYNANTREPGVVELLFEKNRHGPTGTRKMRFEGPTTRFTDLESDDE